MRHHFRHAAADALDLSAEREAYVFHVDVEGMLPPWDSAKLEI